MGFSGGQAGNPEYNKAVKFEFARKRK